MLYGAIIRTRNFLFDNKIISSGSFENRIIGVGNIAAGGTGKSIMIEYLLGFFIKNGISPAVLSRGYKRKTKGFVWSDVKSTPSEIGDEPAQFKNKYPDIPVAVCEKRSLGIEKINARIKTKPLILLDDSFQHRSVKPGLAILLIDYNRPIHRDFLLPAGNLREPASGCKRADVIVYTKCPDVLSEEDRLNCIKPLKNFPRKNILFSKLDYSAARSFEGKKLEDLSISESSDCLLITGIAHPDPLKDHLKNLGIHFDHLKFPDHHDYTLKDIRKIKEKFKKIPADKKYILCTEKDFVKLKYFLNPEELIKFPLFYIAVELVFLSRQEEKEFHKYLIDYVGEN